MEPPEGNDGDNSYKKSCFSAEDLKNYMGYKSKADKQSNPFYLNLTYTDDSDLSEKINGVNLGNADQFRSRDSQARQPNKKPQKYTPEQILKQLNSIDFENAIKERKAKHAQENPTEANNQSNSGNERVDLKNTHLFNMPPSMYIPDSDDEDMDDIYKKFNEPPNYKFETAREFLVNKPLTIVSREEWGALPPQNTSRAPKYPIKNIVITYKTETSACFSREECMQRMRELQKYHMKNESLSDIPFNFMVGHDGTIYEGRGWHAESSRSLESYPDYYGNRLDVAYFGDYRRIVYPPETNSAIIDLVETGAQKGMVTLDIPPENLLNALPLVVPREAWDAVEPKKKVSLRTPVNHVVFHHHPAGNGLCWNFHSCAKIVLEMQKLHMEKLDMSDIAYNFIISGDAMIWEGRGWNIESEPTLKYPQLNGDRIDIAFLGIIDKRVRESMLSNKAMELIEFEKRNNLIMKKFKIIDKDASSECNSTGFGKPHEYTFDNEDSTEKQRANAYPGVEEKHEMKTGCDTFTEVKEGNVRGPNPGMREGMSKEVDDENEQKLREEALKEFDRLKPLF